MGFNVLLKKNFYSELNSSSWLIVEILVILLCSVIIVLNPHNELRDHNLKRLPIRNIKFSINETSVTDLDLLRKIRGNDQDLFCLYYNPISSFTTQIMNRTAEALGLNYVKGFRNEGLMQTYFPIGKCMAGVSFYGVQRAAVPWRLSYTLHFPSTFRTINSTEWKFENYWLYRCTGVLSKHETDINGNLNLYSREGFIQLQHTLFTEWLHILDSTIDDIPRIEVNLFHHETDYEYCRRASGYNVSWLLFHIMFIIPFLVFISRYSRELEENVFTHHTVYGFENYHHWIAHLITSFLHIIVLDIIIVITFQVQWSNYVHYFIIRYPPLIFVILFLILYNLLFIIWAMCIAMFTRRRCTALLCGTIIYLCSYCLVSAGINTTQSLTIGGRIILSICFTNIFPYGMHLLMLYDNKAMEDFLHLITLMVIYLTLMTIILLVGSYTMLYIRRDHVNFKDVCLWFFLRKKNRGPLHVLQLEEVGNEPPVWNNLEYGSLNVTHMLLMQNIFTFYDNDRVHPQLKNISMRFFEGEISVILGADGAGKTAFIRVLAGWRLYVGHIFYEEGQVEHNLNLYQKYINACILTTPIFDFLTVDQTLCYFVRIRKPKRQTSTPKLEMEKWMKYLKSAGIHKNTLVKDLSYERKRLLHLCCMLCNNTPIILLDEPTLHMREHEQTIYWMILQREKANRAIVITTNSVDEAELLGDRIGILCDGTLLAWGSPIFLKHRFAREHALILLRDSSLPVSPITQMIRKHVPSVVISNQIGEKLVYKIPADKKAVYQKMLLELESEGAKYGLKNVALLSGELKDVYMNLSLQTELKQTLPDLRRTMRLINSSNIEIRHNQLMAMFYKKSIIQAPKIFILVIVFITFLVVVILNRMFYSSSKIQNEAIYLGWINRHKIRIDVEKFRNCTFIALNDIPHERSFREPTQRVIQILSTKVVCGKSNYSTVLKADKMPYNKYGAVIYKPDVCTIWSNTKMFHSLPILLNFVHNVYLSYKFPNATEYIIYVKNQPFPIPYAINLALMQSQIVHLRVPITVGLIVPFTISTFIFDLVQEFHSEFVRLQQIAGLRMSIFWVVNFIWDSITFFIYSLIFYVALIFLHMESFSFFAKLFTLLMMNIHCIGMLFLIYILALFVNSSKSKAYLTALLIQMIFGLFAYILYWDVLFNNQIFFNIMMLSPTFALLHAISNLYVAVKEVSACRELCNLFPDCGVESLCLYLPKCCSYNNILWVTPDLCSSIVYIFISATIFCMILIIIHIIQYYHRIHIPAKVRNMHSGYFIYEDDAVIDERTRVADFTNEDIRRYNVVVNQLENKKFQPKTMNVLYTVSFAVERQYCLGIYGSEKSGKTALIQQLIGAINYIYGEVYICQYDLKLNRSQVYKNIGYCPQKYGLLEELTPRQLFVYFFKIRGVRGRDISDRVRELSLSLSLQTHLNKKITELPNAVKRRLNIAVAFIVKNRVLIFDEPTKGLPAQEKRLIWNVLRYARYCGKTVIFSTSDSYECDVLADRTLVLKNGYIMALGPSHEIRLKYTVGLYLEIKLRLDGATVAEMERNLSIDVENLSRFITFLHEHSELVKSNGDVLTYYIPEEKLMFSYLYGTLEKNQLRLNISQYSVHLGSLKSARENIELSHNEKKPFQKLVTNIY